MKASAKTGSGGASACGPASPACGRSAGRSSISFEKWMELDLQYIDKWSLWLDLEILVKTIPAVLRGSGAA